MKKHIVVLLTLVSFAIGTACGGKQPPQARPQPPAMTTTTAAPPDPPAPPQPVSEPVPVPPVPAMDDPLRSGDLDAINRAGALQPVYFVLDSSEVSSEGQKTLQNNAQLMKKYGTWQVTIEGHCDERGTPEYNLALGERRALAARTYLVSLGVPTERLKVISYGKEFPFDAAHSEAAWSKNRRAHFVVTAAK